MSTVFRLFVSLAALASFVVSPALPQQEPEKEGAGLVISGKASSSEVGLPLYPRSTPHKGDSNDSQSARLGLWAGGSGFRLMVVKMDSADPAERVAGFYKKAL